MDIFAQLIVNSIVAAAFYSLIAVSFNLIFGVTKFFNLAHGVFVAVGGYAVFLLSKQWGLPIILGIIIGVIFAGLLGYFLDKLFFLPLRNKKASGLIVLISSLGIFTILQALLSIIFGSRLQTLPGASNIPIVYDFFGASITHAQIISIIVSVLLILALIIFIKKTLFGRAVIAISDDEEVAKIVGINTNKIIGYIFFIGAAMASVAGILFGFDTGVQPSMSLSLLLSGITAAVIGGVGSLFGAILGAILVAFVENFGIWFIAAEWKSAISFGLLIVFLIFSPRGIIKK